LSARNIDPSKSPPPPGGSAGGWLRARAPAAAAAGEPSTDPGHPRRPPRCPPPDPWPGGGDEDGGERYEIGQTGRGVSLWLMAWKITLGPNARHRGTQPFQQYTKPRARDAPVARWGRHTVLPSSPVPPPGQDGVAHNAADGDHRGAGERLPDAPTAPLAVRRMGPWGAGRWAALMARETRGGSAPSTQMRSPGPSGAKHVAGGATDEGHPCSDSSSAYSIPEDRGRGGGRSNRMPVNGTDALAPSPRVPIQRHTGGGCACRCNRVCDLWPDGSRTGAPGEASPTTAAIAAASAAVVVPGAASPSPVSASSDGSVAPPGGGAR